MELKAMCRRSWSRSETKKLKYTLNTCPSHLLAYFCTDSLNLLKQFLTLKIRNTYVVYIKMNSPRS